VEHERIHIKRNIKNDLYVSIKSEKENQRIKWNIERLLYVLRSVGAERS